jgi:Kef-type K+ transport system membrane component KefB
MKRLRLSFIITAALIVSIIHAHASGNAGAADANALTQLLFAIIIILIAAKIGGDIFVRLGQPAVLGELIFGIIIGNMNLLGIDVFNSIRTDEYLKIFAEIGIILLLFQVGLESEMTKMMKVGASSLMVAALGVIAPSLIGFGVAAVFLPNEGILVHLFIGAALCATSVGLTARVLLDMKRINSPEARIILGAAVIDDVLGLILLAVIQGIIKAADAGTTMSIWANVKITLTAFIFLAGSLIIGRLASPKIFSFASKLKSADLLVTVSLVICFGLAALASLIGLAPIVGAFAAGLILDKVLWKKFSDKGEQSVEDLIKPIAGFMVPIFFVRMGAMVDLSTFANWSLLGFAAVLTIAAIIGKQICGLGVLQKGLDKLSIGIGMIPRGEVGLIFAAIGSSLMIQGKQIITPSTFSVVVIMVIVTTMVTPSLLKWSLARRE